MGLDKLQKWDDLSGKALDILLMFDKIKNRQLAETFYKWYLRIIRERKKLGLDTDEGWKKLRR